MNIKTALRAYGLTNDEAKLYLAGVKFGEASLSKLAKEAGIKRTTAYLVASRLEEKGLMGKFKTKDSLKFVITAPEKLEKMAQQKLTNIQEILPQLNLYSEKFRSKPKVSLFEGKDGYLSIFDDPLQYTGITIRAIGSLQNVRKVITTEYDENYFVPERLRKGIDFKGIYLKEEIEDLSLTATKNEKERRELKILPKKYAQKTFKMIYENTIVEFTSKKELVAFKVVSPEIAKAEKARFDLTWDLLGEKVH